MKNDLVYPDPGYTPANLKALLRHYKTTRKQAADLIGSPVRGLHRWCLPLESKEHRDMPLRKWLALVEKTTGNP